MTSEIEKENAFAKKKEVYEELHSEINSNLYICVENIVVIDRKIELVILVSLSIPGK